MKYNRIIGINFEVRAAIGARLNDALEQCISLADQYDTRVTLTFNGRDISCHRHDNVQELTKKYFNEHFGDE